MWICSLTVIYLIYAVLEVFGYFENFVNVSLYNQNLIEKLNYTEQTYIKLTVVIKPLASLIKTLKGNTLNIKNNQLITQCESGTTYKHKCKLENKLWITTD